MEAGPHPSDERGDGPGDRPSRPAPREFEDFADEDEDRRPRRLAADPDVDMMLEDLSPADEPGDDPGDRPRRPAPRRELEEMAEIYEDRRARRLAADPGVDVPGTVGLGLGITAIGCLLLGPFTCGLTFFAAAPLAAVGAGCSAFGRGILRNAGLAVNLLTLVPAVLIFKSVLPEGGGPAAETQQPFVR
jgi:hypothetical protein